MMRDLNIIMEVLLRWVMNNVEEGVNEHNNYYKVKYTVNNMSSINEDLSIASKYTTVTYFIAKGLEALLDKKSVGVPLEYVNDAVRLFRAAHSYFETEGFAIRGEENEDPYKNLLDKFQAKNFVLSAYGRTHGSQRDEELIREGLYFTECLSKIFNEQRIPKKAVEAFTRLKEVYARLYEIAVSEEIKERHRPHDE
jgi:hypothetical protein